MSLTLLVFLTIAVVSDVADTRISNRLIVCGLSCGLVLRILGEGCAGMVRFFFNISIPVILLYLLFQLRALGAGDIKLFSVVGAYVSVKQLIYIIFLAFVAGSMLGVGKMICHLVRSGGRCMNFRTFLGVDGKYTTIHFSIAILIAYFLQVWGCVLG